jgi:small-conductance mechanosensitive channel
MNFLASTSEAHISHHRGDGMGDLNHRSFVRTIAIALVAGALGLALPALGAETQAAKDGVGDTGADLPAAPVEIDGHVLFRVRGTSVLPAEKRAAAIVGRIETLAADGNVPVEAVHPVEFESGTGIFVGNQRVLVVLDADAQLESVDRKVLASTIVHSIQEAITLYRQERSREALVRKTARAIIASTILAVLFALVLWFSRRLHAALESRYRQRVHSVGIQSFQIVRAEQIWDALQRLISGARVIVLFVASFIYLQYVLTLLPWTRGTANRLLGYILDPLGVMGRGIVKEIPDMFFLAILFSITRYLLKLVHLFFAAVGRGEVALSGFDPEWAESTYKLVRVVAVVFTLVVAYPYIPGSDSEAFKGISIFIGIIFSLGSSSAIANLIAGYLMTYRRAFRVGDRVKIGETMGDVIETRLQVTHLKTIKNEEVIIPNSTILNNEVVNYSSLARRDGLILHATVDIGYGTPWRQVEAMLLMAAQRTAGLMKEPLPFILQEALGGFAVTYELNVYCDNAQSMGKTYTALRRNILDVFNEYGVQIMTPAYEGDPEAPKVVRKEDWFNAPAQTTEAVINDGHKP